MKTDVNDEQTEEKKRFCQEIRRIKFLRLGCFYLSRFSLHKPMFHYKKCLTALLTQVISES
jgi:hypothetical protein